MHERVLRERESKGSFENSHWGETVQMQSLWQAVYFTRKLKRSWTQAQLRKVR